MDFVVVTTDKPTGRMEFSNNGNGTTLTYSTQEPKWPPTTPTEHAHSKANGSKMDESMGSSLLELYTHELNAQDAAKAKPLMVPMDLARQILQVLQCNRPVEGHADKRTVIVDLTGGPTCVAPVGAAMGCDVVCGNMLTGMPAKARGP